MSAQMSVKSRTITPIIKLFLLTLAWTPAKIGRGVREEAPLTSERTVSKAMTFLICVFGTTSWDSARA